MVCHDRKSKIAPGASCHGQDLVLFRLVQYRQPDADRLYGFAFFVCEIFGLITVILRKTNDRHEHGTKY